MKKFYGIIPLLALACLVSFTRCDTADTDKNQLLLILLADQTSKLEISTLNPADEQDLVSASSSIWITFNGSLDGVTMGTITLGGIKYENGVNCIITFQTVTYTNDQILLNPDLDFKDSSISGLTIRGFKDTLNKTVNISRSDYNFNVNIK